MQTMGGLWDTITGFVGDTWDSLTGGGQTDYTAYYEEKYGPGSAAGFRGDWATSASPALSYDNKQYMTQEDWWWKQYSAEGGVLPYNSTTPSTTSNTNFFNDMSSGAGDFFNGITSALQGIGGLFSTGVKAYADLQQTINSLNPQDHIVVAPGSNQPFIRRDGQLIPLLNLYPQLNTQVTQAQQKHQTQTLLLVGALGVGLVLILNKKKK